MSTFFSNINVTEILEANGLSIESAAFFVVLLAATILVSWFVVGKLIHVLKKLNIVDQPNQRTLHTGDIPRGGGLVIVGVLLTSVFCIALLSPHTMFFLGLALYVSAWAALSWYDDRFDASPRFRFACQILFACLAVLGFGYVDVIQISADSYLPLGLMGAILTVVGIVWMANLYNFMDGIDGLAASQAIVASITLAFWFIQAGAQLLGLSCLLLGAASYGFLLWNWSPAKIFMGDVGSIVLGAWFALMAVIGVNYYDMPILSFIILMSVFISDASITLVHRILKREKFWLAHRTHHYQRLVTIGFKHSVVVFCMLCLMLGCSILASISIQYRDTIWICLTLVVILIINAIFLVRYLERKKH